MRERVGHGEVGRREDEARGRWAEQAAGPRLLRRPPAGPRPVRPVAVVGAVRPREAPRPAGPARRPVLLDGREERTGLRVLARPCGVGRRSRYGLRRAVAGLALAAAAALVVVVLGLVAGAAGAPAGAVPAGAVQGPAGAPAVVTAAPGETVWEVADRVAPGLSGAERAEFAARIVTDNGLSSVRLEPGQVLHVPGS